MNLLKSFSSINAVLVIYLIALAVIVVLIFLSIIVIIIALIKLLRKNENSATMTIQQKNVINQKIATSMKFNYQLNTLV